MVATVGIAVLCPRGAFALVAAAAPYARLAVARSEGLAGPCAPKIASAAAPHAPTVVSLVLVLVALPLSLDLADALLARALPRKDLAIDDANDADELPPAPTTPPTKPKSPASGASGVRFSPELPRNSKPKRGLYKMLSTTVFPNSKKTA